jgi:hypothetical protein
MSLNKEVDKGVQGYIKGILRYCLRTYLDKLITLILRGRINGIIS